MRLALSYSPVLRTASQFLRTMSSRPSYERVLTLQKLNPLLVKAEYAVRGKIPIRSDEIKAV